MNTLTHNLKKEMRKELEENILPFWRNKMTDHERGGFYGRMDGNNVIHPDAEKGAVMNARILWSFSAAYRVTRNTTWLDSAQRAKDYVLTHFVDPEHGGVYWSLNADGTPLDTKKQTYAIGFAIYGLSEYARATADIDVLKAAINLFHNIEEHAYDPVGNGYIEALTRDWQPIADMRLSDKDENASRTMNTHLHVIEPYVNLLRCINELRPILAADTDWMFFEEVREEVRIAVRRLLVIFRQKILNRTNWHLDLFFNDNWEGKHDIYSYGHDIEGTWLIYEAAEVYDDQQIMNVVRPFIYNCAMASRQGLRPDGSMTYERWINTGQTDEQCQWWVLCENVIGNVNLYQHFKDEDALQIALRSWQYVKDKLIDRENGEWYWAVTPDGEPDTTNDKAGFWKCPYHNSRMCIEILERNF